MIALRKLKWNLKRFLKKSAKTAKPLNLIAMSEEKENGFEKLEKPSVETNSDQVVGKDKVRRFDPETIGNGNTGDRENEEAIYVDDMYGDWFLDYASYVILERAVPHADDGLKPVQRRILHSMKELEDGRYNKVANIIGNTMKYHPHGDASIGDAIIQIGQKDLLIDTQGNWGNLLTGDSAAAPRYIEARLTPFAMEVVFSPKVTVWAVSYDGRNKEPVSFPG